MSIDLSQKQVIITGSTDGLGKLTALDLAKLRCRLTLHGRNWDKLETLKNDCLTGGASSVDTICCDLTDTQKTILLWRI